MNSFFYSSDKMTVVPFYFVCNVMNCNLFNSLNFPLFCVLSHVLGSL